MASQGRRPSVARCALPRATVWAPSRSLIAVRVNAQANVGIVRPQSTLYNVLLNPVSLAQSQASREARARAWGYGHHKGAASDRKDGPVEEHGFASTNYIESTSPQNSGVTAVAAATELFMLAPNRHT